MPPAFRPPGQRLRRRSPALRASVEPLPVLILPGQAFEGTHTSWWRGEDSNLRRLSRQIYSLIPLAAREPLQKRGRILWQQAITVNRWWKI